MPNLDPLAVFFILAMVVGLGLVWTIYLWPLNRTRSTLARAAKTVKASRKGLPDKLFPTHSSLGLKWTEFLRTRRDSEREIDGKRVGSVSAADFFHEEAVLRERGRLVPEAAAGAFAGLGLLGTFLGILLGLSSIRISDPAAVMLGVEGLLGGMSTAFSTSVVGIALSISWALGYRIDYQSFRQTLNEFVSAVDLHLTTIDSGDALLRLYEHQARQTALLQNLGTDIAQAVEDAMNRSVSPALTDLSTAMDELSINVQGQQLQGLGQLAKEFQERLNQAMEGQFERLAEALREAAIFQEGVNENLSSLSTEFRTLAETHSTLLERSSSAASWFESSAEQLKTAHERLSRASEALGGTSDKVGDLFVRLTQQVDEFHRANEGLRVALASQLDVMAERSESFATAGTELRSSLEQASEELRNSVQEFTQFTAEKLGEVFHRFDAEMATVVEHLGGTLAELREVTEDLSPSTERLQNSVTALIPAMDSVREGFNQLDILKALTAHTAQLAESLPKTAAAMDTLQDAVINLATGMTTESSDDASPAAGQ